MAGAHGLELQRDSGSPPHHQTSPLCTNFELLLLHTFILVNSLCDLKENSYSGKPSSLRHNVQAQWKIGAIHERPQLSNSRMHRSLRLCPTTDPRMAHQHETLACIKAHASYGHHNHGSTMRTIHSCRAHTNSSENFAFSPVAFLQLYGFLHATPLSVVRPNVKCSVNISNSHTPNLLSH